MALTYIDGCDCGFVDSNDPTGSTFGSIFFVDFTSISRDDFDEVFVPANYEIKRKGSPFTRRFMPEQVSLSDVGLQLSVSPATDTSDVACGAAFSRDKEYHFGSYHAKYKAHAVPGTVLSFHVYKSDTSEVDVEYRTFPQGPNPMLEFSTKPQIYIDGNASNLTYIKRWIDGTTYEEFARDFHDWSFVWLPDAIHFGFDANYSAPLTTNVAQEAGTVVLSHWSDGNEKYSQGPPPVKAVSTISSIWAIYNGTGDESLPCKSTRTACVIDEGTLHTKAEAQRARATESDGPRSSGSSDDENSAMALMCPTHSLGAAAYGWLILVLLRLWLCS